MNKECRSFKTELSEDNRFVEGYALVFNSQSNDLGGFKEIIEPSSLDGVLERSDVLCLLNHNEDKGVLARYNMGTGSLELSVDEKGLKYRFEAPHTALGEELLEGLKRGDITTSSFAFSVEEDDWTETADGTYLRTINKFDRLYDVSPVYRPAYSETMVELGKRSLDKLEELKEQKNEKRKALKEYYESLRKTIKDCTEI